jgi:hypothetical protein
MWRAAPAQHFEREPATAEENETLWICEDCAALGITIWRLAVARTPAYVGGCQAEI